MSPLRLGARQRAGAHVRVDAHLLARHRIEREARSDFGDPLRALGDHDELHDRDDQEHDATDHDVVADDQLAERVDDVAGIRVQQDQLGRRDVQCEPEQRREQQQRRKGRQRKRRRRVHRDDQQHEADRQVRGDQQVEQRRRQRQHEQHHHEHEQPGEQQVVLPPRAAQQAARGGAVRECSSLSCHVGCLCPGAIPTLGLRPRSGKNECS